MAYVERVLRDGTVVVSEDNMNRTFMWRRIPKGAHYPRAFIRYPRSNGSVSGRLTSVKADDGRLTIEGSAGEPDRQGRAVRYEVTVGAPRSGQPIDRYRFESPHFVFRHWRSTRVTGDTRCTCTG